MIEENDENAETKQDDFTILDMYRILRKIEEYTTVTVYEGVCTIGGPQLQLKTQEVLNLNSKTLHKNELILAEEALSPVKIDKSKTSAGNLKLLS